MSEKYSVAQLQRLIELNAGSGITDEEFEDADARNSKFKAAEKELVRINRDRLKNLMNEKHLPLSLKVEADLTKWLTEDEGFTKVATPIMISAEQLDRMNITQENALREQVFWVSRNKCLRPMLAPNLYIVMRNIRRITKEPVRIFECGSCFRKESRGAQHMNEFTMLNLVELAGVAEGEQTGRLEGFARNAMKAVGIDEYDIVKKKSEVYGETLDIEVDGVEIASGAFGPHPLDDNWEIFDTWVGIGLGIERIAMVKGEYRTIGKAGKSTAFIDGIPLRL